MKPPNLSGICMCGCGKPTKRAAATNLEKQRIKGEFQRYRTGHGGKKTLAERFWPKVVKGPGCWEWTGSVNHLGYGSFRGAGDRTRSAHRTSYELSVGPIPDGLHVCHKCDRPSCVNPEHLFLGTHTDNMHDMFRKGRNGHVALTREQTAEVKKLLAEGWEKKWIAAAYGVGRGVVENLKNRKFPEGRIAK